jgi:MoaA/NifB/PqqE/SkfB family radical SAM enzyme
MIGKMKSKGNNGDKYRELFNTTIGETISKGVRMIGTDPSLLISGTKILHNQRKTAEIRRSHEHEDLLVPPVMIISITSRCNLTCAGCYMHEREHHSTLEMTPEVLSSVIYQAAELGVSIIVIAGGEPFVRQEEILRMAKDHPQVLFPVFSNGLLINKHMADVIATSRNIVPVISFEGFREDTDARRGTGVFDRLLITYALLKERHVFFGCSVTTTRDNFYSVTSEAFIRQMVDNGVRVFTYVEYVPMTHDSENLILTQDQKKNLQNVLSNYNQKFPALFIGFPGDEDYYGGCLAAGRGFVHVSPSGDLEPCPAVSYSDSNLTKIPLKEALKSRLLFRLREVPEVLTESVGGCVLRANQAWVNEILVHDVSRDES